MLFFIGGNLGSDILAFNNFHGRILESGDYVGKAGEVIGNIRDYLP